MIETSTHILNWVERIEKLLVSFLCYAILDIVHWEFKNGVFLSFLALDQIYGSRFMTIRFLNNKFQTKLLCNVSSPSPSPIHIFHHSQNILYHSHFLPSHPHFTSSNVIVPTTFCTSQTLSFWRFGVRCKHQGLHPSSHIWSLYRSAFVPEWCS